MITFKQFLHEMPLMSITKHDRFRELDATDTKGSFEPADRKVIQKFMDDGTYKEKLKKIPFPLYVYIADDFDLERHGYEYPEGEITYNHRMVGSYMSRRAHIDLEKNVLRLILKAVDQNLDKDSDSVHLIIGDNYSSEGQIALTPWMIAHRLSHSIFQGGGTGFRAQAFERARNSTLDLLSMMKLENFKSDAYKKVFTFKSAQAGKLLPSEAGTEICTQYLVTGKIGINYDAFTDAEHRQQIKYKVQDTEEDLSEGFKALAGLVFYI